MSLKTQAEMMAKYLGWKFLVIRVTTLMVFELITASCQVQEGLKNHLLLHYDFDNMTESRVFDKSGNKRFAQMHNQSIVEERGRCQKGIALNSRPLHIAEGLGAINKTQNLTLTVAAWIFLNESQDTTDRTIFAHPHETDSSDYSRLRYFGIHGKDKRLRWVFDSTRYKTSSHESALKLGVWQHVAVTFTSVINGTTRCTFFVNGIFHKSKPGSNGISKKDRTPDYVFLIGSKNAEGLEPLNGVIDDFYVFNKALSQEQIKRLMNNSCQQDPAPTSPVTLTENEGIGATTTSINVSTTTKMTTTSINVSTTTKMDHKKQPESINNTSEAKKFIFDLFGERLPVQGPPSSKDEPNSAINFTKEAENTALVLARNTLKLNQSLIVNTTSALLFMKIPISGFTFPSSDQPKAKKINESISFPDELVKTKNGVQRAFVCIAYLSLHESMAPNFTISSGSFPENSTLELSSNIIGAAVDPPLNRSLTEPITITFNHAQILSAVRFCSFWNHSIRNAKESFGQWSTQGCKLDKEQSSPTKTVCSCDHLTNFALLLQRKDAPYSEPPLSLKIITIVGCTLSILGCLVCFIMFFTLKRKYIRHYLHINLTFAIAVSQLILLFGISRTKYEILCKAMAACLHYFFMVAFFLMLSEGVHLAILIETAFSHGKPKLPVYLIASWGLPLIIVGVTLGTRYDNYGGQLACFISANEGTVYAFVGPFALILLINTFILVIILRQVINKTSLPISSQPASKMQIARATIRSLIMLFPVMGFTWIFGILFFGFRTLVFEYIFAIFCSLQGFFVFLFQYALNTESRLAFMRATRRFRLTFTSSLTTAGQDSMKQNNLPAVKISSPDEQREIANASYPDNCHLIVYRPADNNHSGSTMDSRTTSTFI